MVQLRVAAPLSAKSLMSTDVVIYIGQGTTEYHSNVGRGTRSIFGKPDDVIKRIRRHSMKPRPHGVVNRD